MPCSRSYGRRRGRRGRVSARVAPLSFLPSISFRSWLSAARGRRRGRVREGAADGPREPTRRSPLPCRECRSAPGVGDPRRVVVDPRAASRSSAPRNVDGAHRVGHVRPWGRYRRSGGRSIPDLRRLRCRGGASAPLPLWGTSGRGADADILEGVPLPIGGVRCSDVGISAIFTENVVVQGIQKPRNSPKISENRGFFDAIQEAI